MSSYHVISCHIMSCHVVSCYVLSCRVVTIPGCGRRARARQRQGASLVRLTHVLEGQDQGGGRGGRYRARGGQDQGEEVGGMEVGGRKVGDISSE